MKKIVSTAVALAVAGAFGLGTLTASPAAAQQEQMEKAPAKKSKQTAARKAGNKSVMAAQEALNRQGANLKVDGRMGPRTRAALKEFQSKNGLKPSGNLDAETRAKLGL